MLNIVGHLPYLELSCRHNRADCQRYTHLSAPLIGKNTSPCEVRLNVVRFHVELPRYGQYGSGFKPAGTSGQVCLNGGFASTAAVCTIAPDLPVMV